MTLEEKIGKTLEQLGVTDYAGVEALFGEVLEGAKSERLSALEQANKLSLPERDKVFRTLRDRWLARKNGLIARIDENWLKRAPKDLKPVVGRRFNVLRQLVNDIGEPAEGLTFRSIPQEVLPDLTLPGYRRARGSIHPV